MSTTPHDQLPSALIVDDNVAPREAIARSLARDDWDVANRVRWPSGVGVPPRACLRRWHHRRAHARAWGPVAVERGAGATAGGREFILTRRGLTLLDVVRRQGQVLVGAERSADGGGVSVALSKEERGSRRP